MEGVTKTPRGLHCLQAMGTSSPGLVMLINSQHVSDPRTQIRSNKFGNNSISERLPTNNTDYKKATVAWSLYASMAKTQYTMIDREIEKQIMVRVFAIDPKPKPVLFCHIILLYRKNIRNSMFYANGSLVFSVKKEEKNQRVSLMTMSVSNTCIF